MKLLPRPGRPTRTMQRREAETVRASRFLRFWRTAGTEGREEGAWEPR